MFFRGPSRQQRQPFVLYPYFLILLMRCRTPPVLLPKSTPTFPQNKDFHQLRAEPSPLRPSSPACSPAKIVAYTQIAGFIASVRLVTGFDTVHHSWFLHLRGEAKLDGWPLKVHLAWILPSSRRIISPHFHIPA